MKKQVLYLLALFSIGNMTYSQDLADSKIIKKEQKPYATRTVVLTQAYDLSSPNLQCNPLLTLKYYSDKNDYVFYNEKFYPAKTFKFNEIKNLDNYSLDIIKIPDSISKDIKTILFLKLRQ